MKKQTKGISINIVSAVVILLCLFVGIVQPTNSWFTSSHSQGVQIEVNIGELKLALYQDSVADENKIFNNEQNKNETNKKYVSLTGEIVPEEEIDLTLILKNEDLGAGMYMRFKFEVFKRGLTEDTLIPIEMLGVTAPVEAEKVAGFVKAGGTDDPYYYYMLDNEEVIFQSATPATKPLQITLLTGFKVPLSSFVNTTDGSFIITNSDTIYLKLTIESNIAKFITTT